MSLALPGHHSLQDVLCGLPALGPRRDRVPAPLHGHGLVGHHFPRVWLLLLHHLVPGVPL